MQRMQDAGCRMQRMQDAGCRMQDEGGGGNRTEAKGGDCVPFFFPSAFILHPASYLGSSTVGR
jgi:hypothetical protein